MTLLSHVKSPAPQASGDRESSAPLRCGVIGYGYMGEIRHRVIMDHPELELVTICEPSKERLPMGTDAALHTDWREALREDLDIVFICTPNNITPDVCVAALEGGRHVFCEKPPGRSLGDVDRMIAVEREPLKLMFGFNHRFHPGILEAKAIVEGGRLGKIVALRGVYGKSGGLGFERSWRNEREVSGGGILLDQGIHMLDLFCHFCGDFEHVKCFASNNFWNFEIEDNAFLILRNEAGQTAGLHSSATLWKHTFRLDIILDHGYLVVEGLLSKTGSYGRERLVVGRRQFEDEARAVGNPAEEIMYFDRDESWRMEVDALVHAVRTDEPVSSGSSAEARRVMRIIEAGYRDAGLHVEFDA